MGNTVNDCTIWDNSNIFKSLDDPKIKQILDSSAKEIYALKEQSAYFQGPLKELESHPEETIPRSQRILLDRFKVAVELRTIGTYARCITSTDAKNEEAKKLLSKLTNLTIELFQFTTPLNTFIARASDEVIENILNHEELKHFKFQFEQSRKRVDFLLSTSEEQMIQALSQDGLHAWGTLYQNIAGQLVCDMDGEKMGYAKTAGLLRQGDREKRKSAWKAINAAWEVHQESSAAILNAINGWRIEDGKLRDGVNEYNYLDSCCHQSHISRQTLDSLIDTTFEKRSIGQRALKAMAKGFKLDVLAPWDILAPAPSKSQEKKIYGFKEGVDLISEAFGRLNPAMGEFTQMMYKMNWIDAKESDFRAPGAYCTGFSKQREPRVFMTYDGSISNVLTLAHELGHAYHSWVMRDMPLIRTHYAMTTAETASIFGETLVRDYLFEQCKSDAEKFDITWQDAESAATMLCNIPSRFEFEKRLMEKRRERTLPPSELKSMMKESWKLWYEDSLSEYDEMFWASKLHFSMSHIGFYNYPYLFGYLFSLGIYAQKENYGDGFNEIYTNILRDTGSMNAIELIKKHFGKDIEARDFWQDSLKIVDKSVTRFENLL